MPTSSLSHVARASGLSTVSETDAALVTRARDGDLGAFATLMSRYRDTLGRYAFHMLGSREDAEEAVQDSFVRAHRALADCRQPERFGAWLFTIMVNRCRTAQRRLFHRRRHTEDLRDDVAATGDTSASIEWREEIARALAELRPHYREAFLLRYVEGLDYAEMARLTGAREPTLRMRVKRAGDRLRLLLRDVHAG
ncbi:MAG TPA: sigma-70 family RNA polymerase sigma factor [Gemmatimonadales bacterium]|nr:sigma-70 family RNA polymerase sigma factor [Gemmatimonadales bacterium]